MAKYFLPQLALLIIDLAAFVTAFALPKLFPILTLADLRLDDLRQNSLGPSLKNPSPTIAILTITEETLAKLP